MAVVEQSHGRGNHRVLLAVAASVIVVISVLGLLAILVLPGDEESRISHLTESMIVDQSDTRDTFDFDPDLRDSLARAFTAEVAKLNTGG